MQADWRSGQRLEWADCRWKINQKKFKKVLTNMSQCDIMLKHSRERHESETITSQVEPWKLNNDEIKKEPWNYFVSLEKLATVNSGITDYKKSANDVRAN